LAASKIRFLLYCHDTFGLGHVRRTLSLAAHFTAMLPNAEVLIVTGSPLAHAFTLPPRTDYIKLPAVTKMSNGAYRARSLDMEFAAIRDLRTTMLRDVAQAYRPNVFLVDHAPQGLKGEVLPTLAMLRATQPDCLRVLGLRDIIDASSLIQRTWAQEGVYDTLEHGYDLILVYGSQQLYDIGEAYALPAAVERRVRYCGYLDRVEETCPTDEAPPTNHYPLTLRHALLPHAERLVVLTAGGGGDGFPLMHAYLLGLQRLPSIPFASVLVTGPLMETDEQRELHELATTLPTEKVRIEAFLPDPLPLLSAADLVVSMAGYNTTCELLALRQRVLLVPRATPRQEQLIRASLLARHGLAHMLHPEQLTPERLLDSVQQSLSQPRPHEGQLTAAGISFHGQTVARQAIVDGLYGVHDRQWMADRVMAHVS
jgi:predicted glycosyltransferase